MRIVMAAALVAGAMVMCSMRTASAATCGNGIVEAPEECDQGGFCVGSANAGTHCTAASDCPSGECKIFGGSGCAANCTTEHDVPYVFVPGVTQGLGALMPGTSGIVAATGIGISLAVPASGKLVLTVGKAIDGQIPVVVKADSIDTPAIPVNALGLMACGCVHGAIGKTCGGNYFLQGDSGALNQDCTADETVCTTKGLNPCTPVNGPGNTASGVIGCTTLPGSDLNFSLDAGGDTGIVGPIMVSTSGTGGPGSAAILTTIGVDVLLGPCTGTSNEYGPDGMFCTADDHPSISLAATLPTVTGTAEAVVTNLPDGGDLGPIDITGAPFSCAQVAVGNPVGASLVASFAVPNVQTVGSLAVTLDLVAQAAAPAACVGDCDGSLEVTVDELISMVNIALGVAPVTTCTAGDSSGDGEITVDEIVAAVNKALVGCA